MQVHQPRPVQPEELPRAFGLLFAHQSAKEREYRVARALEFIAQGELDPTGIFVLGPPDNLTGVIICQSIAGAGALIWPPMVCEGQSKTDQQDLLVKHACDWLRQKGARLAQCLLADEELFLAEALLRNSFAHVTGLTYMRYDLRSRLAEPSDHFRDLSFSPYDPALPQEFHATLARTYEGTLDCPEVNGVRSIEEVIQGHQAQGRFDPSRWWLARRPGVQGAPPHAAGQPVGVLLLMEQSAVEWDLAYIGIVAEARRRGVGRSILQHALRQAQAGGATTLTLSVDDRNLPARRLYEQAGFEVYDHRQVLLSVWRPLSQRT